MSECTNPLAVGTFCPACDTRLTVGNNSRPGETARECPVCSEREAS
jgi:hypothetical protein